MVANECCGVGANGIYICAKKKHNTTQHHSLVCVCNSKWFLRSSFFFFILLQFPKHNMGKQSIETESPVSDPTKFSILNLVDLSNPNINQSVNLLKQVCFNHPFQYFIVNKQHGSFKFTLFFIILTLILCFF